MWYRVGSLQMTLAHGPTAFGNAKTCQPKFVCFNTNTPMHPRPFVNDALWRTLCPGFAPNALLGRATSRRAIVAVHNRALPPPVCRTIRCERAYHSSTPTLSPNKASISPASPAPSFTQSGATLKQRGRRASKKPGHGPLVQLPTHILYEHLRDAGAKGDFDKVLDISRILVKDRGEQPNKDMYNAVLHSCVSVTTGSAGKLRKVLEEMGFWNDANDVATQSQPIELDARGCECVLEALAVHPDYLLRTEILQYMRSRWFALSDRGHNFVVAGLLRERLFEQALETLEQMVLKKIRTEDWLFDQALWTLLEFSEVEEAFLVLGLKDEVRRQTGRLRDVSLNSALWNALLDAAGQKQLYEQTSLVWNSQVQPGYLKPGTGSCLNVLTLASRHGDVHLATDVFRILTDRGTVFNTHHYELLVATYLNANDLSAALSAILIMVDTKLKVNSGTCQPLYWYLSKEKEGEESRPLTAFGLLQQFEAQGRNVPTAALNACLHASINLGRFGEAIEIYKALHTISHSGPNTETFNVLFRGCYKNKRKELAMFLANEMIQLGLKPDRITYDRLILVCLQSGDIEEALLYYEEMRTVKKRGGSDDTLQPRRTTWELLIQNLVTRNDDRAVALLKEYQKDEPQPRANVGRAVTARFVD